MNLNDNLLRTFAKAINATNEKETKLYYGTITRIEEVDGVRVPYVHLDGSEVNSETPLIEGTEVMVEDRVIVTIENHKAVVMSNITSPASARTASSYMDLFPEGLVIGEIDNDPSDIDFNVLIKPDGMYIRYGVDSTNPNDPSPIVLARYAVDGVYLGENNEIVIKAATIKKTVERFDTTSFKLSKTVSSIESIVGDVCIDTDTGDTVNDVTISPSDYIVSGQDVTIYSPLSGTTIVPQSIVVTYRFSDKPIGTMSIGTNSVISEQLPFVIGNNNGNKAASNVFSVDWAGKVSASGGCNAKIVYVEKTVSNLTIPSTSDTKHANFTTSVSVPTGYVPCGLLAYQIKNHLNTCCFTKVDVDMNGTIKFTIQNHGSTTWNDESAYFQVACIRTV